jgi:hypothetical protein
VTVRANHAHEKRMRERAKREKREDKERRRAARQVAKDAEAPTQEGKPAEGERPGSAGPIAPNPSNS